MEQISLFPLSFSKSVFTMVTGTSYATRELNQHIPVYCGTKLNLPLLL